MACYSKSKYSVVLAQVTRLEDLPNVGKATAGDLRRLGFHVPSQLKDADPWVLYEKLRRLQQGGQLDPCVLDVLISIQRFLNGAPATPWWEYTAERKQMLLQRKQLK